MASWHGRYAQELKAKVLAERGRVCHLCGAPGADSVDHIVPRKLGGDDSIDNLLPAHLSCNSSRGAKSLEQWRAIHPKQSRASPSRNW